MRERERDLSSDVMSHRTMTAAVGWCSAIRLKVLCVPTERFTAVKLSQSGMPSTHAVDRQTDSTLTPASRARTISSAVAASPSKCTLFTMFSQNVGASEALFAPPSASAGKPPLLRTTRSAGPVHAEAVGEAQMGTATFCSSSSGGSSRTFRIWRPVWPVCGKARGRAWRRCCRDRACRVIRRGTSARARGSLHIAQFCRRRHAPISCKVVLGE